MAENIEVQFKDVEDVTKFVDIMSEYDGNFDLYCGTYCVDAKSFLGILTMDLRNKMFLKSNCENSQKEMLFHQLKKSALAA